jgi:chromosome partitioning protein
MITVAVVNTKGGVGKTTIAASLAVRAAQERFRDGKAMRKARVAIVDLDPQNSLGLWWKRRPRLKDDESPCLFTGVTDAADAVERANLAGYEWCILDGPPAFLTTVEDMIKAADLALIPVKPSTTDLYATQDTVVLARKSGKPFLLVFNDVGPKEHVAKKARQDLFSKDLPFAKADIVHRVSHITGMNAGKTAAEVNGGKDKQAAGEIDSLWNDVKKAAAEAVKAGAKAEVVVVHGG